MERSEVFTLVELDVTERISKAHFCHLKNEKEKAVFRAFLEKWEAPHLILSLVEQWNRPVCSLSESGIYGIHVAYNDVPMIMVGNFVSTPKDEHILQGLLEAKLASQLMVLCENLWMNALQISNVRLPSEDLLSNYRIFVEILEAVKMSMRTTGVLTSRHWQVLENGFRYLAEIFGIDEVMWRMTLPAIAKARTNLPMSPFFANLESSHEWIFSKERSKNRQHASSLAEFLISKGHINSQYDAQTFIEVITKDLWKEDRFIV